MTIYRGEHGDTENIDEADVSICGMMGGCGCATKSMLSEDKTHYLCGKCGNTK
jgi:ribosomal protein S27AE